MQLCVLDTVSIHKADKHVLLQSFSRLSTSLTPKHTKRTPASLQMLIRFLPLKQKACSGSI